MDVHSKMPHRKVGRVHQYEERVIRWKAHLLHSPAQLARWFRAGNSALLILAACHFSMSLQCGSCPRWGWDCSHSTPDRLRFFTAEHVATRLTAASPSAKIILASFHGATTYPTAVSVPRGVAMKTEVLVGDVLDVPADVLISTANPWLQMTGGVNLKIILRPRGEFVHEELQRQLRATGGRYVQPGTVVRTGPGSLPVRHILHAVSIDPSYDSSVELVADTIVKALTQARELNARTVTMPALATGFGPLSMEEFTLALSRALGRDWSPLAVLTVVLRQQEDADTVRAVLARSRG
jgi:O-acetyl-ADP-ribose deacetylase (regulator of RNase III)